MSRKIYLRNLDDEVTVEYSVVSEAFFITNGSGRSALVEEGVSLRKSLVGGLYLLDKSTRYQDTVLTATQYRRLSDVEGLV